MAVGSRAAAPGRRRAGRAPGARRAGGALARGSAEPRRRGLPPGAAPARRPRDPGRARVARRGRALDRPRAGRAAGADGGERLLPRRRRAAGHPRGASTGAVGGEGRASAASTSSRSRSQARTVAATTAWSSPSSNGRTARSSSAWARAGSPGAAAARPSATRRLRSAHARAPGTPIASMHAARTSSIRCSASAAAAAVVRASAGHVPAAPDPSRRAGQGFPLGGEHHRVEDPTVREVGEGGAEAGATVEVGLGGLGLLACGLGASPQVREHVLRELRRSDLGIGRLRFGGRGHPQQEQEHVTTRPRRSRPGQPVRPPSGRGLSPSPAPGAAGRNGLRCISVERRPHATRALRADPRRGPRPPGHVGKSDSGIVVGGGLLEHTPQLGIRRSLPASRLPPAALDYLAPRPRVNYFFEPLPPRPEGQ